MSSSDPRPPSSGPVSDPSAATTQPHRSASRDASRAEGGRVGMISLGCPKNRVDSEIMLGHLRDTGYQITPDLEGADTVIVNTCGFIEEAKQESIDAILEVAARKSRESGEGKVEKLLVAGCMVNRFGEELAEAIPEIDGFIGLDDLDKAPQLVQLGGGPAPPSQAHVVFDHREPRLLTTRGFAYLKVAEGCDNPCTFCAIPKWRGAFRSRTIESLVEEARHLEDTGIRELCLIAQDTTRYGFDLGLGRHGLTRLVEALLEHTEIPWIRFLYAYPTTLDEELLRLMGQEERFCSYLDMPLQHSHPEMLKAMRRAGGPERYLRLLERARELAPDIFLRTTYIVGFPGETEEHFQHLVEFIQQARFDHLGAFVYSPEPGTPGADLKGRIPRSVARRRYEKLLEVQKPIAKELRQRLVGDVLEVLVEGVCEETEHLLQARHRGMAPDIDGRILINDGFAPAGTLAQVEITEAYADDLVARIVGPSEAPGLEPAASLEDFPVGSVPFAG
ncbi:MAG: 30S ribosomal protein S12 methylthiotransferase RimO [Acidobacteriota bacterium]|nr:30S ribosomal protein S12 methylthiotransferase RimO [Acidobacteriota bacterium]